MADYTAVDNAGSFFKTVLYTATGSSLGVTGAGFQPDFTWIKNRDASDFHVLTDAVRGATKYIQSNSDTTEVTDTETLKTFDSDGFTVGTTAQVNTNTEKYVSWNWKAGTTTGIAGSPSITPTGYSFNQTSGQSIIHYTGNSTSGATIPHGLGVAPDVVITKCLATNDDWFVYHSYLGPTKYIILNTYAAAGTATNKWNDVAPSSTLVTLGDSTGTNRSEALIAYCFANIQGYSNFGHYVGNGNTDGTFVYTGFQPQMIYMRRTDGANYGLMADTKRDPQNVGGNELSPSQTNAEGDIDGGFAIDILSNGFKPRAAGWDYNGGSANYIYMAWASNPFVNSGGVPGNAR